MIPFAVFEKQIAHLPQAQIEIVLEIRNIVARLKPEAVERIDRKGITYYDASRGGPVKASICQVFFMPDHVRLAFIHGAFLPDPQHLLQGNCLAKRGMRLDSFEQTPWEAVIELITASAQFDPMTLAK